MVREEKLRCCEAYAGRAAGNYGDFSKAGAVDGVTTGGQRRGWIVVGERHVGVWRAGIRGLRRSVVGWNNAGRTRERESRKGWKMERISRDENKN